MAGFEVITEGEWCAATERIRERFGLQSALEYLVGEKFFTFVGRAEYDTAYANELPFCVAKIRQIFTEKELTDYLHHLKRTKYRTSLRIRRDMSAYHRFDDPTTAQIEHYEDLRRFAAVSELLRGSV